MWSAHAYAHDSAQTVVHMRDYMSVDYSEFVKNGRVLDEAEYKEQQEFSARVTELLAAAILLYVGVWLHGKSYARAWQTFVHRHLQHALQRKTLWALAGVSFLAVYREAFETVLFYQALWQKVDATGHAPLIIGFTAGFVMLALVAWTILHLGLRLPIGVFFGVSSALLAVLAVVFTGHGAKALQEAGILAASPVDAFNLPALVSTRRRGRSRRRRRC